MRFFTSVKHALFLLIAGLILVSCATFQKPELVRFEGVKFNKLVDKSLSFTVSARVKNDNAYSLKVKPCHVNVYLQDQLIGKVSVDKKVKIKKKTEASLSIPLRAALEDGALLTILRYSLQREVSIRVQGKLRLGASILSGRFAIDTSRVISGNQLKFDIPR